MNVKLAVEPIENASATNVVRVVSVSHFVDEMMTVATEKCVNISFVQPDVDLMRIALVVWRVRDKNVLIHVKIQLLVVRMPIVSFKIMQKHAFARIIWSAIQISAVSMHQPRVQHTTSAHQIIRASEIFANRTVTMIKVVWLMNDAYVERVDRFVIRTLRAEMDRFVRIDCVKSVVAMI